MLSGSSSKLLLFERLHDSHFRSFYERSLAFFAVLCSINPHFHAHTCSSSFVQDICTRFVQCAKTLSHFCHSLDLIIFLCYYNDD